MHSEIRSLAAEAPRPCHAGGVLEIDLGAIAANWRLLAGRLGAAGCAAVVKADAYGLDALAAAAGTIGYEILTSLGARDARTYHSSQS